MLKFNAITAALLLSLSASTAVFAAGTSNTTGASGDNLLNSGKGAGTTTGASQGDMLSGNASTSGNASAAPAVAFDNDTQIVRKAQEVLKTKGQPIKVDGMMGPRTRAALKEFQREEGVPVTGQLDALTLIEMGIEQSGSVGSSPAK